jgi:predicted aspartyl protease
MGIVKIQVEVFGPRKKAGEDLEVLVDTGATVSVFPEKLLKRLGVKRIGKIQVRIGDGRRIVRQVGNVQLKVDGESVWSRVIFGKSKDPAILGLPVLEQLGLAVDPGKRRIVRSEHLLLNHLQC